MPKPENVKKKNKLAETGNQIIETKKSYDDMIESNVKLNESVDKNEEDVSENVDQTVKLSIKKLQLWKKLMRPLNCGKNICDRYFGQN